MSEHTYLAALQDILEYGTYKEDRTGTGTYSLHGLQMRYDLRDGFPLFTTKKVFLKGIIHELLWFIKGSTNAIPLQQVGVHIWDEWRRPYSLNRNIVVAKPKTATLPADYNGTFSLSGYFESNVSAIDAKLAQTWKKMMQRCYDPKYETYGLYGGRGVTVHPSWHDVGTFIQQAKLLPHWWYKENAKNWSEFELDKDYFGSNQYGPDTCVWLRSDENNLYTRSSNPMRVIDVDGVETLYLSVNQAAEAIGIARSSLHRFVTDGMPSCLKQGSKKFAGWVFEKTDPSEFDGALRLELIQEGDLGPIYGRNWRRWPGNNGEAIDQLQQVIDGLKKDPYGRRHIVSAWNVADIPDMALPPCHTLFQFIAAPIKWQDRIGLYVARMHKDLAEYTREEQDKIMDDVGIPKFYLDCVLYQRSGDMFLGVPFNVASYSLLLMMVAEITGMEPREFIHHITDAHIYANHVEQVKEQLTRTPRKPPKMKIAHRGCIDDFLFNDFVLSDYDPYPAIKAPVAV